MEDLRFEAVFEHVREKSKETDGHICASLFDSLKTREACVAVPGYVGVVTVNLN